MAWDIRSAVADDAGKLPAIEAAAGLAFLQVEGLEWVAGDDVEAAAVHRRRIEAGCGWVAVDQDGGILGFLTAESLNGALHIWSVQTLPDRQRQGIGRGLIAAAEAHAKTIDCTAMTLTTFRDVPFNAPFYARCGFEIIEPSTDPDLAAILAAEAEHGLPADRRCAMRKPL